MTMKYRVVFEWLAALALLLVVAGACCCAPMTPRYKQQQASGEYMVASDRLYQDDGAFDLRKKVVYAQTEGTTFNSDTNVSNKLLTTYRCTWCHECSFPKAWDIEHVGQPGWQPRYRGKDWEPAVRRMRVMDGSMLNEQIADRIFSYLRDESTGKYDP